PRCRSPGCGAGRGLVRAGLPHRVGRGSQGAGQDFRKERDPGLRRSQELPVPDGLGAPLRGEPDGLGIQAGESQRQGRLRVRRELLGLGRGTSVKCWNCQTEAVGNDLCPACGRVQPLANGATLFDVLGLPRGVEAETGALERAYRERSLRVHPDRVAKDDGKERRLALERTALLNEAYRTLKAPEARAFYLLKLHGMDLLNDEARAVPVPSALLEEALELREQLEDAQGRGDEETITALSSRARTRAPRPLPAAQSARRRLERVPADPAARAEAASALARLRYHRRFLEAVDQHQEEEL